MDFGQPPWDDLGWRDDDPGPGPAGVREPRHPLPLGPMSGAGDKPMPEPMSYLVMSDPRR